MKFIYFAAIFLLSSYGLFADRLITGYQDKFYVYDKQDGQNICQYDFEYIKQACIDIGMSPIGSYAGFKQLLVFSKQKIKAIDFLKQDIKWSISLKNIYKIHINYPVIFTFSKSRHMTAFDYFTGIKLWDRPSNYSGFYESGIDLWLVSDKTIERIDLLSSDIVDKIKFSSKVDQIYGEGVHLFIESKETLYYINTITQKKKKIGKNMTVLDIVSDYLLIGNQDNQQIISRLNEVASENVQQKIIKVHTATKSYFAFINNKQLHILTKHGQNKYQLENDADVSKIKYVYKLNKRIRVFYDKSQDIWELKEVQEKPLDQDT